MTTSTPDSFIAVDRLQATLSQVVTTMLGIGLDESNLFASGHKIAPLVLSPSTLSSAVRFHGAWQGECVVCCEPDVARELTYRFLGLEPDSLDEMLNEIKDCMGEVANIVAGNLKNLLPRGVDHSVPQFGGSSGPPGDVVLMAAFNCTAGPLWIGLIKHTPGQ